MKTKSTSQTTRAKAQQPYDDAKRPCKRAPKPRPRRPPPNLPSKRGPLVPGPGAVLFRTLCLENVQERYPGLEIRHDFDLVELAGLRYKGTPAEIYAEIDKMLAYDVSMMGYERAMEACKKTLDTYVEPTGIKPKTSALDDKYMFVRPIPGSEYSLRLFPGSISAAEYCLDFVETATGKPVNSPFEYELWGIPNPDADTPWLSIPMVGKLRSIERAHGVKQADIDSGEEKFVLRDGQTCVLVRPGKRSLRFTVPVRKLKKSEDVVEEMDVVDLPRYIEP